MCTGLPDVFVNKRWLINEPHNIASDALTGLVKCNPNLALLDFGKVVVQRDHIEYTKVKILSGGASGHEPSFAGFVGRGMLTAAVQGEIYSSPTPQLVLKTIKELARRHERGILVIIGDNMGDRLSFGLAVERAKNIPNVKIKMIHVADDCNVSFERRGIVGSLLIQKIAGAMAEAELFLYDIDLFMKPLLSNISTVLVSLKPAVSPHFEVSSCTRPSTKNIEFGSGMHGNPGYYQTEMLTSKDTVKLMLSYITNPDMKGFLKLNPEVPVVVLINNLGNSSKIEEFIFINEVTSQLAQMQIEVERVYSGTFLTSLEMCGMSLTIMNVIQPEILLYLDAPCEAPFWKSYTGVILDPETSITISTELSEREKQLKMNKGPAVCEKTAKIIEMALGFACGALISCEKQLNLLDSESGDADTGTNFKIPAFKINDYLSKEKLKTDWPFMLFTELSKILETCSDGLTPCFYAIMCEAAAQPLADLYADNFITVEIWAQVLDSACNAVQRYGNVKLGQCTMYDALQAGNQALAEALSTNVGTVDSVGLAVVAAEEAARKTRREGCLYPDPGAHAVGIWMRAVYETLKLHKDYIE